MKSDLIRIYNKRSQVRFVVKSRRCKFNHRVFTNIVKIVENNGSFMYKHPWDTKRNAMELVYKHEMN